MGGGREMRRKEAGHGVAREGLAVRQDSGMNAARTKEAPRREGRGRRLYRDSLARAVR